MRIHKTIVELNEVLVTLVEQTGADMGNENEIKRLCLADFAKLLEAGQVAGIIVKILGELDRKSVV